jgi:hypothetical protein
MRPAWLGPYPARVPGGPANPQKCPLQWGANVGIGPVAAAQGLIHGGPMAFVRRNKPLRDKVTAKPSLRPQSVRFSSTLNVELRRRAAAAG